MATEQLSEAPQMGQCSVTGKMVPEDELVTIHGQRVCAEGKAILLQRLKAGEAMPGEMERPPVLRRVGCIFLDMLILGIPFWIIRVAMGGSLQTLTTTTVVFTLIQAIVQIIYFGQFHANSGQTLGKMAGKIILVNRDGSPVSVGTAYIRALLYPGPSLLVAWFSIVVIFVLPRLMAVSLIGGVNIIVGIYFILDSLFALFDRNAQRALHDRIAGTRVILK
jgi:uncharacterized RDD family membrane protein YckC